MSAQLFFADPATAAVAVDHGVEPDPALSTEQAIVLRGIETQQRILGGIPPGIAPAMLAVMLSDLQRLLAEASSQGELMGRVEAADGIKDALCALVDQAAQVGDSGDVAGHSAGGTS